MKPSEMLEEMAKAASNRLGTDSTGWPYVDSDECAWMIQAALARLVEMHESRCGDGEILFAGSADEIGQAVLDIVEVEP